MEVLNCVINGLCKAGELRTALELFSGLPQKGLVPTVATYSGLCKGGHLERASDLVIEMEAKGCAPNVVTFNTLMRGFCHQGRRPHVIEILRKMKDRDVSPDASTASIIIDLLSKDEQHLQYLNLLPTFPRVD
ncbi:hypothetical protein RJ640_019407 [Escallonia rubra]|uniref:Pentatricopeptide repeat-containing protein n=1 Tax=Escallonia rubra TaxID=112253 RepID=A0AA88QVX8_9ASTE|nr:hypothetical protein RJ640_019407 [Escallonia rubra]